MYKPMDLSKHLNAAFNVKRAGGLPVLFEEPKLRSGRHRFEGVPFQIGGGKVDGCIAVSHWTTGRRCAYSQTGRVSNYPRKVSMRINRKCDRILFLHSAGSAAYLDACTDPIARYEIVYRDGKRRTTRLHNRKHITDMAAPFDWSKVRTVWMSEPMGESHHLNGLGMYEWTNPRPTEVIRSVTFEAEPAIHGCVLALLFGITLVADEHSQASETASRAAARLRAPLTRRDCGFPRVGRWHALVGDFHCHTDVDSEGHQPPRDKVREAWADGLDVLAVTDHLSIRSWPAIRREADRLGLLVVPGVEENLLDKQGGKLGDVLVLGAERRLGRVSCDRLLARARQAGALTVWAHPGADERQLAFAVEQLQRGMMDGVELHNGGVCRSVSRNVDEVDGCHVHRAAWPWHRQFGTAVFANSDSHAFTSLGDGYRPQVKHSHRPKTIMLTSGRSWPAVRAAVRAGRTLAWFDNTIWGDRRWLRVLWRASVRIDRACIACRKGSGAMFDVQMDNRSAFPFRIRFDQDGDDARWSTDPIELTPRTVNRTPVRLTSPIRELREINARVCVENLMVGPDDRILDSFQLKVKVQ